MNRLAGLLCSAAVFFCVATPPVTATEIGNPAEVAQAMPSASPAASAAPVASPTPNPHPTPYLKNRLQKKRLTLGIESYTSFVDQHFVGPGITPPEGPQFTNGAPNGFGGTPFVFPAGAGSFVAPVVPYEFFSGGAQASGNAIHQATFLTPSYQLSPAMSVDLHAGYGSFGGTGNVGAYWGERTMPTINPHTGQKAVVITPGFPVGPKQDSASGTRLSILDGTIGRKDGALALNVGWFDLKQSESFVVSAPPSPQTPAFLTPLLPHQLNDAAPTMPLFAPYPLTLPVHGVDLYSKVGLATVEATDADLAMLPGSSARLASISGELDRGHGLTYGLQFARVTEGGSPIPVPVLFGGGASVEPSALGPYPSSTVSGQNMVIGGGHVTFPLSLDTDVALRYAHSCVSVSGAALTNSTCTQGNYTYGKIHHGFQKFDLALEAIKAEATYGGAVLPYGTIQNNWYANALSYPRTAPFGTYQLPDLTLAGPNRQGYRVSSQFVIHGIETRVAFAAFDQIDRYDANHAQHAGFVEPYFLPQLTASGATQGHETRAAASFLAHPKWGDVRLDLTDDTIGRTGSAGHPEEAVAMHYPGATFSVARPMNKKLFASVGAGRYAADGSYNNSGPKNADLHQNVIFAGFQWMQNPTSGYHVEYRMYSTDGRSPIPFGPSPAYHGPMFYVEQRLKT